MKQQKKRVTLCLVLRIDTIFLDMTSRICSIFERSKTERLAVSGQLKILSGPAAAARGTGPVLRFKNLLFSQACQKHLM